MIDRVHPTHMHVGLSFVGHPKIQELLPTFDLAWDWIRYSDTNWLVWTNSSEDKWQGRILPHLSPGDHVLIVRIDPLAARGWLPRSVWEWLNREKPCFPVEPAHHFYGRKSKS